MSSLMWLIFIFMLALLVLALGWFAWKLRNFSQSQSQSYHLDDKLMQAMLNDEALSKRVKKALLNQAGGRTAEDDEEERQLEGGSA